MTVPAATGRAANPRRRWALWTGIVLVQLLLMGSAFVGGRMLAGQNQRGNRVGGQTQLPSALPRETPAGTGQVQRIQGQVFTIGRGQGGGGGQQGGAATNTQTDVAVTADTKYYKNTSTGFGQPGGGAPQFTAEPATFDDVKIGTSILAWGQRNGTRITAEVVYIQNAGR